MTSSEQNGDRNERKNGKTNQKKYTFGDSKACFVKEVSEDEESLIGQSDIMIYIKQK